LHEIRILHLEKIARASQVGLCRDGVPDTRFKVIRQPSVDIIGIITRLSLHQPRAAGSTPPLTFTSSTQGRGNGVVTEFGPRTEGHSQAMLAQRSKRNTDQLRMN